MVIIYSFGLKSIYRFQLEIILLKWIRDNILEKPRAPAKVNSRLSFLRLLLQGKTPAGIRAFCHSSAGRNPYKRGYMFPLAG
jgi:hypothetical protein